MSDADLLRRAQRGDDGAWRTLFDRALPALWRYTYARCGNHAATEEVVSETLLALVRGLPALDADSCHLNGWLRRVAHNKLCDLGRFAQRERRLLDGAAHRPPPTDDDGDPARPMERNETRRQVLATLDQLSDLQRDLLECKYLEKLSVREIATRYDLTEKAAESLLYRARREFRQLYNTSQRQTGEPTATVLSDHATPRH